MKSKQILNLLTALLGIAGTLFKVWHFTGATFMLLASASLMLATLFMYALKDNKEGGASDMVNYLLVGSLSLFILGLVFKAQHYPGSEIFYYLCFAATIIVPLMLILSKDDFKVSKQYIINLFPYFMLMLGIMGYQPLSHLLNSGGNTNQPAATDKADTTKH